MTREHKHAVLICITINIIAVLGIIFGIILIKPLIIVLIILPAVIYELYLTKGFFVKSILLLSFIVVLAEIYAIIAVISVDLSKMTGGLFTSSIHAGLIGPVILVILAIYLLKYAAGIYSKWLSIIILLSSLAIFYIIDPVIIPDASKSPDDQENIKKVIQI